MLEDNARLNMTARLGEVQSGNSTYPQLGLLWAQGASEENWIKMDLGRSKHLISFASYSTLSTSWGSSIQYCTHSLIHSGI